MAFALVSSHRLKLWKMICILWLHYAYAICCIGKKNSRTYTEDIDFMLLTQLRNLSALTRKVSALGIQAICRSSHHLRPQQPAHRAHAAMCLVCRLHLWHRQSLKGWSNSSGRSEWLIPLQRNWEPKMTQVLCVPQKVLIQQLLVRRVKLWIWYPQRRNLHRNVLVKSFKKLSKVDFMMVPLLRQKESPTTPRIHMSCLLMLPVLRLFPIHESYKCYVHLQNLLWEETWLKMQIYFLKLVPTLCFLQFCNAIV